jgi:hypothetical protein
MKRRAVSSSIVSMIEYYKAQFERYTRIKN